MSQERDSGALAASGETIVLSPSHFKWVSRWNWELGGTPLALPLTHRVTLGKSFASPFGAALWENEDSPIGPYSEQ